MKVKHLLVRITKCHWCLPIVLFLLGNIDSQWMWIVVQHNASIKVDCVSQLLNSLKFDITESFELISLFVLNQTNILHCQLAEDLNHVALYDSLRQVTDEREERWLSWQCLLALIVESEKQA